MNRRALLVGILSIGFFLASHAVGAQPALEQFRFDPPRLCPRDTVRFGFSYLGFPGSLAAVKNFVLEGVWEGLGERPFRSFFTPTREDPAPYTTDEGRFESRRLHAGPRQRGCRAVPRFDTRCALRLPTGGKS
jgi:hypothetical protein